MKIINFKLYNKTNIFICVKFINNWSHVYNLNNEIISHNLNTKTKIYNYILKMSNKYVKKIYLYKIYNSNKYNQKHTNSCKKL